MALTVQLLSVVPLGACVRLAVESTQGAVVLPVVGVDTDVQLPSCPRHGRFKPDLYSCVKRCTLYVGYAQTLSVAGEPVGEPLRRLRLREMFFKGPSLRRGETETARAAIGPLTITLPQSLSPQSL